RDPEVEDLGGELAVTLVGADDLEVVEEHARLLDPDRVVDPAAPVYDRSLLARSHELDLLLDLQAAPVMALVEAQRVAAVRAAERFLDRALAGMDVDLARRCGRRGDCGHRHQGDRGATADRGSDRPPPHPRPSRVEGA